MSSRDTISRLHQRGVLEHVDVQLAQALQRLGGEVSAEVTLGAALASRAVQRGHVCADLPRLVREPLLDADDMPVTDIGLPKLGPWLTALSVSPLVGPGEEVTPLVIDDAGRLYLRRYFDYEQRLARQLRQRAERSVDVDESVLREGVERLFPETAVRDGQRRAATMACRRRLAVISGGPGTGKTTTVVKILALLQEQALARSREPLRIVLVAPTGKAAQRLGESIDGSLKALPVSEAVKRSIPTRASTIHRALGFMPATPTRFRHGVDRPLCADVVLADEASMIDLALMTKLVEAVAMDAHLIILGDKDQLSSIEAGAILGDIYDAQARSNSSASALASCMVELTKSYRYDEHSGIGALAGAINRGDPDAVMTILKGEGAMPYGEVAIASLDERYPFAGHLGKAMVDGYRACLTASSVSERLQLMTRFRILCAHRRGPLGVDVLNGLAEQHLRRAGLLELNSSYYDGRPIMITRNDHQLGLFNGDVGVIHHGDTGVALAWFAGDDGPRALPPSRLPPHETVFAMTVHKSQGSEFDRVAVVLPSRASPILTRELVYTGVSRARSRVDIHGAEHVLCHALGRRIERGSGLSDALWATNDAP